MQGFAPVAVDMLRFWFLDGPRGLVDYFASLNRAVMKFFSLQILARSYTKPWKNEYREGLVGFSIFMGMFIKTFLILFDLFLLAGFVVVEVGIVAGFVLWPFVTIGLLFY